MVVFFLKAPHCPTLSLPSHTCMHLKLNLAKKGKKAAPQKWQPILIPVVLTTYSRKLLPELIRADLVVEGIKTQTLIFVHGEREKVEGQPGLRS